MRDQSFGLGEFEFEVIAQELAQLPFDFLDFGAWPVEAKQPIICLCRAAGYADPLGACQIDRVTGQGQSA